MKRFRPYIPYLLGAVVAAACASCSDPVDPIDPAAGLWTGRGTVAYTRGISLTDPVGQTYLLRVDGTGGRLHGAGTVPCRLHDGRIVIAFSQPVFENGKVKLPWSLSLGVLDGSAPPVTLASGTDAPTLVFGVVAITADGGKVAYLLGDFWDTTGHKSQLYVVPTGGGAPVMVSDSIVYSTTPVFSPDGTRLAFYAGSAKDQIAVADLAGGSTTVIARNAYPWAIENLDWSGVTDRIVYVGSAGARRDLFTMDPDGSDVLNITEGLGGDNRWPTWSPDGTQIAFVHDDELWTIGADGTGARQITQPSATPYRIKMYPEWSPDGTMILFTAIAGNGAQGLLQVVDLATLRVNALALDVARGFWVE